MARRKERREGARERKRGVVEKLHPAHCIERRGGRSRRRSRRMRRREEKRRRKQMWRRRVVERGWRTRAASFWSRRDAENSVPI